MIFYNNLLLVYLFLIGLPLPFCIWAGLYLLDSKNSRYILWYYTLNVAKNIHALLM